MSARALALLGMAVVSLSACSSSSDGDAASTTTVVTTTTTTTTTATTTTVLEARDLPSCGDRTSYSTVPDWKLGSIPDGWKVDHAKTSVNRYAGEDLGGYDTATASTLAAVDADGRVVETVEVTRFPDLDRFEPQPGGSAGHAYEASASSVRGHGGTVGRLINRSNVVGFVTARWIEGGVGWIASGLDDPDALLAALDPLDLSTDVVSDPTGRFTVLGSTIVSSPEDRDTSIELIGADETDLDGTVPSVTIEITDVPDGATGLAVGSAPAGRSETVLAEHDGRTVLTADHWIAGSLPDGSRISIDDRTVTLTADDLLGLLDAVVPVSDDDPYEGPLTPAWYGSTGEAEGPCTET